MTKRTNPHNARKESPLTLTKVPADLPPVVEVEPTVGGRTAAEIIAAMKDPATDRQAPARRAAGAVVVSILDRMTEDAEDAANHHRKMWRNLYGPAFEEAERAADAEAVAAGLAPIFGTKPPVARF